MPPHNDGSPYQCLSAHAGNPAFIDLVLDSGYQRDRSTDVQH
jgi:4-alpha-glucanotransferase